MLRLLGPVILSPYWLFFIFPDNRQHNSQWIVANQAMKYVSALPNQNAPLLRPVGPVLAPCAPCLPSVPRGLHGALHGAPRGSTPCRSPVVEPRGAKICCRAMSGSWYGTMVRSAIPAGTNRSVDPATSSCHKAPSLHYGA